MIRFVAAICLSIIVFTTCGAFNTANADDGPAKIWSLSKVEMDPEGGHEGATLDSGGTLSMDVTETSIAYYRSEPSTPKKIVRWLETGGDPAFSTTKRFDFTPPPETLVPGEVVTITVTGQYTFTGSKLLAIGSSSHPLPLELRAGVNEKYGARSLWIDGSELQRMEVPPGTESLSKSFSFTVPAEVTSDKEVSITFSALGGWVHWRYRPIQRVSLSLDYSPPLVSFEPGTGTDLGFAGELVATLKDGDGKGIEGKTIIFYIDKEEPAVSEPGKNLFDVLAYSTTEGGGQQTSRTFEAHPYLRKRSIDPELDASLFNENRIFFGDGVKTDSNGEAIINTIDYGIIDPRKFSGEMIGQRGVFLENGKVSGNIIAGVYNEETKSIVHQTTLEIEYPAMAKILSITGKGRTDLYKQAFMQEYPDSPPWGLGSRVRLNRTRALPHFKDQLVEEGDLLMPGDMLDIDSDVKVEIAWITGDKVTARVPGKSEASTSTEYHERAYLWMLSSAYDSGFKTPTEKISDVVFGFGAKKGVELLVQSIPYVGKVLKEGGALVISIYTGVQDIDFSGVDIITRVRIRSEVIIDNTGEDLKIYNLEGSPDIQTVAGGEVTLAEGTMVAVSDTGVISPVETFDLKEVEKEYNEIVKDISRNNSSVPDKSDNATGSKSLLWIIIGVIAIVVVTLAIVIILKRTKT